ncbi:MAG: hypothetical protein GX121_10135 [Ignavibacteria bacterium]|nr:hypothetical protein [Ignavibacteria bacterium]
MRIKNFYSLIIIIFASFYASAQEISVFFDEENKIEFINAELNENLNLFTEYPGFKEARVFQSDENTFFLVIQYQQNNKLHQNRVALDSAAYLDLKKKVSTAFQKKDSAISLDRDGRPSWLVGTTCLSLGFYGWAIPTIFDIDGKSAVATYLLTSAAGFLVPYFISERRDLSYSQAQLSNYGGATGILHGFLFYELFNGDNKDERLATMLGVSVAELVAGFIAGKNLYKGYTDIMTSTASFGTAYGFGLAATLGLYSSDKVKSYWAASALLGTAAGYYVGSIMANKYHYTPGDAFVVTTFGLVGGYVPVSLLVLANTNFNDNVALFPILGSLGGLFLGHYLNKEKDFSDGNGVLVELGTIASALFGAGLGYLFSNDSGVILSAGAAGSVLGLAGLYSSLSDKSKSDYSLNNLKINFQPSGLLPVFSNKYDKMNLSIVNVKYDF